MNSCSRIRINRNVVVIDHNGYRYHEKYYWKIIILLLLIAAVLVRPFNRKNKKVLGPN